jgi:hypothetical protein
MSIVLSMVQGPSQLGHIMTPPFREYLKLWVLSGNYIDDMWSNAKGPWETKRLTRVLKRKIANRLRVTLHKFDYRHVAVGIGRENAGKMFSNGYDDNIVKMKEGKVVDKNIDIIELHNSRGTSIGTRNHTISINIVKDVEV